MWAEIQKTVLKSQERTAKIPDETKKHDYIMRLNGFLIGEDAKIGDEVEIKTLAGRLVKGTLIKLNPEYTHNFGCPVEELMHIGEYHKKLLTEENNG